MRKYGIDNFIIEEIEEINDDNILNEREQYWIKYYDTFIKNGKGYNCTLGGEGNILIDRDIVYKLWDEGYSIQQISSIIHNDRSVIRNVLKKYKNYSIEISEQRGDKIQAKNRFKSIIQYDIKGNYLNTFYNMHEAERQTNISSKLIWNAVHLKQKVVGGYQWRFIDDKEHLVTDLSNEKIMIRNQKVKQIDKDTNKIIKIYKSAAEASRETNICDLLIRKVCQHKGKTAGGYKWEYC